MRGPGAPGPSKYMQGAYHDHDSWHHNNVPMTPRLVTLVLAVIRLWSEYGSWWHLLRQKLSWSLMCVKPPMTSDQDNDPDNDTVPIQVSSSRHYRLFIILQSHKCPGNYSSDDDLECSRSRSLARGQIVASGRWTTRQISPADSR